MTTPDASPRGLSLGVSDARPVVRDLWRQIFAPVEWLSLDEWAEKNIVVPEGLSPEPGPWRNSVAPYCVEPMRAWDDPTVREVVLMFAAQTCKTSILINGLLRSIAERPAPTMIVFPDADSAKELIKDRITPHIHACPAARAMLTGKPWDEKSEKITTKTMTIRARGSHSRAKIASWPIAQLIEDEIDEFAPDAVRRAEQRTTNFPHRKIVKSSTPTYENTGIHREFLRGDQCRYAVPCPHCGGFQFLHFHRGGETGSGKGGVRWEGGLDAEPDEVERTAWYECEHCGGRIENHHKGAMLAGGRWVPRGQTLLRDGTLEGEHRATEVRSFTISALYSPWQKFGAVAREFVEAGGDPPMSWVNGKLAEPYKQIGTSTEADQVVAIADRSQPRYARGSVLSADNLPLLTGAIDVQGDHLYWEVRAWRVDAGRGDDILVGFDLVDWGRVDAPSIEPTRFYSELREAQKHGADPMELVSTHRFARIEGRALIDRSFPLVDPKTGRGTSKALRVWRWAIDANFDTETVMRFARRHLTRVLPMQGRDSRSVRTPIHRSRVDKLPDGRPLPGGLELYLFDADYFRDIAYPAILRESPAPGATRWPEGYDLTHARQLTAEHRKTEMTRKGMRTWWERKPGRSDNHLWDCWVMQQVLLDLCVRRELARLLGPDRVRPRPRSFLA